MGHCLVGWHNAFNLTLMEPPFSGMKQSESGRENGRAAIKCRTQIESVYLPPGDVEAPH